MTEHEIKIDKDALLDIIEARNWYSAQKHDLGFRFQKRIISQISKLKSIPERYPIK
jgi:hypothetical protein